MAGKRTAGYDLNADNWDKEEEPEDRGVFKTASEDELKNRVIKKARRKMVGSSGDGEAPKLGAFASFSGKNNKKLLILFMKTNIFRVWKNNFYIDNTFSG